MLINVDAVTPQKRYYERNKQKHQQRTLANRMKWDATEDQLISFAEGVLRKAGRAFAN
jgi:hypothetical protein